MSRSNERHLKKILIYLGESVTDEVFTGVSPDYRNAPFAILKQSLLEHGCDLQLLRNDNLSPDCDRVLFTNTGMFTDFRSWPRKAASAILRFVKGNTDRHHDWLRLCLAKVPREKLALFLWEGPAVNPWSYNRSLLSVFPLIFTWNDDLVDNKKYRKFFMPIAPREPSPRFVPFERKKLLVNISMNKTSTFPRELYSARERTILFFDEHHPTDFDHYGVGWETYPKKINCYRGTINSKRDVLPNYKFCLAYENLAGEKGYITEKIFDAMQYGTVPVYLGAPNITDYVDADTFVDRRQFASEEALAKFLYGRTAGDYEAYLSAISRYLSGDKFARFSSESFVATVTETLGLAQGWPPELN